MDDKAAVIPFRLTLRTVGLLCAHRSDRNAHVFTALQAVQGKRVALSIVLR